MRSSGPPAFARGAAFHSAGLRRYAQFFIPQLSQPLRGQFPGSGDSPITAVTDFDGAIRLFYLDQNFIAPKKQVSIFYNPSNRPLSYGEPIKCSASYVSCGDNSEQEKSHTVKIPAMSIVYTED